MAFAPPVKTKVSSNLAKSTWTPMSHPQANNQVFEERRELIKKWFEKWQEAQKKTVVDDIMHRLSTKHLMLLTDTLKKKFPQEQFDFTRIFPRVLTLYLFSFLDPRTLCRCAQVSWYWNYLTELDCLWRPKCLRFGWYPTYQTTPFEEKVWKRFYVKTVHELHYVKPKESVVTNVDDEKLKQTTNTSSVVNYSPSRASSSMGRRRGPSVPSHKQHLVAPKWEPPPWKGSDPHPIDTVRYNYLDNSNKNKNKKSSGSIDSRPTSRQSKRPKSATGSAHQMSPHSPPTLSHFSPRSNNKIDTLNSSDLRNSRSVPTTPVKHDTSLTQPLQDKLESSNKFELSSTNETTRSINPSAVKSQSDAPFAAPDITRLSLDAGVRPKPVARIIQQKTNDHHEVKEKENKSPSSKSVIVASSHNTTNTSAELKGKGWSTHEEDDDF
ncbi:F-box only protein 16-like [Ciona intestinalis]